MSLTSFYLVDSHSVCLRSSSAVILTGAAIRRWLITKARPQIAIAICFRLIPRRRMIWWGRVATRTFHGNLPPHCFCLISGVLIHCVGDRSEMALLPMNSFPGCVFIEARMLGQPAAVVSQVGLSIDAPDCSVAVFCKCSLCFLTSYLVYSLCYCCTFTFSFLYTLIPLNFNAWMP